MGLLNRSIAACVLILVIVIIRALFLHKLPKRIFPVLWGVVAFRLLVPFEIPSRLSVYSIVNMFASNFFEKPVSTGAAAVQSNPMLMISGLAAPQATQQGGSLLFAFWLAGAVGCALFFIVTHLRFRREYKTALPVNHQFVIQLQQEYEVQRKVKIRQSDRIATPLTYGIIQPVILLPKQTDWADETRLRYVLAHEFVHIRRFDTLTKLLSAAALCLHWFNPFVWLMYVLMNRDIELACDEAVIKTVKGNDKSVYALTLIGLEEKKNQFTPLVSNFNKNAVEERIVSIMKFKKTSFAATLVALLLVAGVIIVFATSAAKGENDRVTPQATDVSLQNSGEEVLRYPAPGEANNHSNYTQDQYAALIALKTDGYRDLTIEQFDRQVEKVQMIYNGYNPNDENATFMKTLLYATSQLAYAVNNDTPELSISTASNKRTENDEYYGAELSCTLCWEIANEAKTTVGRRDDTLNTCQDAIQTMLESKDREQLASDNALFQLETEMRDLEKQVSTNGIKVKITVDNFSTSESGVNHSSDDSMAQYTYVAKTVFK